MWERDDTSSLASLLCADENAIEMLRNARLSLPSKLGIEPIDWALPEGIRAGECVEVYGPSQAGKTRLLLQVAARVLLPRQSHHVQIGGCGLEVFWFDVDMKFDAYDLVDALDIEWNRLMIVNEDMETLSATSHEQIMRDCLQRCHVTRCVDALDLVAALTTASNFSSSSDSLDHGSLRVFVIDSLNELFLESCQQHALQLQSAIARALSRVFQASNALVFTSMRCRPKCSVSDIVSLGVVSKDRGMHSDDSDDEEQKIGMSTRILPDIQNIFDSSSRFGRILGCESVREVSTSGSAMYAMQSMLPPDSILMRHPAGKAIFSLVSVRILLAVQNLPSEKIRLETPISSLTVRGHNITQSTLSTKTEYGDITHHSTSLRRVCRVLSFEHEIDQGSRTSKHSTLGRSSYCTKISPVFEVDFDDLGSLKFSSLGISFPL